MGCKVHVVQRQPEYGACGFNWNSDGFRRLLDNLGCNTSGKEDDSEFDCRVCDYKRAVKAIAIFVKQKQNPNLEAELDSILDEVGAFRELLTDCIAEAADGDGDSAADGKYVLETMVSMLVTRDKTSDHIEFVAF